MRILWFNLATDLEDPILGFTTSWISAVASKVEVVHVITMRAGRVEVPRNVRIYSVGKERDYSRPLRAVQFYGHLLRILQDRIDVCFSHMIPIFSVLAAPLLRVHRIPILTWYAHPKLTNVVKLAHLASRRIVTSVPTAYPYKHDKLATVGQGIDTDLFAPNSSRPDEDPLILCVGRLSPVKDHPTLLEAVALLKERREHSFRVAIVGGPAGSRDEVYSMSLRHQARTLGLEDVVRFEPPVPQHALPEWYRRSAVHVNLSRTGFGDKVAWEAMACARVSVVANEGYRDTLGTYAEMLIFKHGDARDLSEHLFKVLTLAPQEREEIGRRLRERVVHFHSLRRLADNLVEAFYREVRTSVAGQSGGIV